MVLKCQQKDNFDLAGQMFVVPLAVVDRDRPLCLLLFQFAFIIRIYLRTEFRSIKHHIYQAYPYVRATK